MTLAIHEDFGHKKNLANKSGVVAVSINLDLLGPRWMLEHRELIDTVAQKAQEGIMSQTVAERTADQITESAHQASRATGAIADAFEDSVGVVRRAAKQSGDAAEEFFNDTTQRFQRHLVLTVAAAFAVGVTSGALIGWMMKRG